MSDNLEAPKRRFGNRPERRERSRQDVRAIAYVQLGDGNGGIIVNISESGMALAAAEPLDHEHLPQIRFQLPRSAEIIELTGEITWQSDSRRRVGIKFVDLPERAKIQIRNWISSEVSLERAKAEANGPQPEPGGNLPVGGSISKPGGPAAQIHASETLAGGAQPPTAAREGRPHWRGPSSGPGYAEQRSPAIAEIDPLAAQEQSQSPLAGPANGSKPAKVDEKRHHERSEVAQVIYIELGEENGGLITNLSETGLAVQAAKLLGEDTIERMRFRLRDSDSWIDAAGKIIWRGKQRRKQVGIQFVDLPEIARRIIAEWVAVEGKRGPGKNATNVEALLPAPVHDRQNANTLAISGAAVPKPSLPVNNVRVPTPAAIHLSQPGRGGMPALRQFGQDAIPNATPKSAAFRWGLFAAVIAIIAGLSFAAGMAFGPHAWRSVFSKDAAPIVAATHDPPQSNSSSTPVTSEPSAVAQPSNPTSSTSTSADSATDSPKPAQASSPGQAASRLQNSVPAANLPASQSKPEDLTPLDAKGPTQSHTRKSTGELAAPPTANVQTTVPASSAVISNEVAPKQVPRPANVLPSEATAHADSPATATPGNSSTAKQTPPAISQPVSSPILKGSVAINSRFRSIRVPPAFQGQTSQAGESLQIGQLTYSRTPAYPPSAVQQRIEGIVRLSAIIGADGSVKNVETISGPAVLAPAAIDAVRSWRYGQSFLGTQPIEIQQDVTIVFRIVNSAPAKNP